MPATFRSPPPLSSCSSSARVPPDVQPIDMVMGLKVEHEQNRVPNMVTRTHRDVSHFLHFSPNSHRSRAGDRGQRWLPEVPLFWQERDGPWLPTLRLLHKYPCFGKRLYMDARWISAMLEVHDEYSVYIPGLTFTVIKPCLRMSMTGQ